MWSNSYPFTRKTLCKTIHDIHVWVILTATFSKIPLPAVPSILRSIFNTYHPISPCFEKKMKRNSLHGSTKKSDIKPLPSQVIQLSPDIWMTSLSTIYHAWVPIPQPKRSGRTLPVALGSTSCSSSSASAAAPSPSNFVKDSREMNPLPSSEL